MAWKKGQSGNVKGKPIGTISEVTAATKAFFMKFTYENGLKMQEAFDRVLEEDPQAALDLYLKYSERIVPKLSSSTVDVTSQGQSIAIPSIIIVGNPPESD